MPYLDMIVTTNERPFAVGDTDNSARWTAVSRCRNGAVCACAASEARRGKAEIKERAVVALASGVSVSAEVVNLTIEKRSSGLRTSRKKGRTLR